jgi:hypothetical protein
MLLWRESNISSAMKKKVKPVSILKPKISKLAKLLLKTVSSTGPMPQLHNTFKKEKSCIIRVLDKNLKKHKRNNKQSSNKLKRRKQKRRKTKPLMVKVQPKRRKKRKTKRKSFKEFHF